MTTVGVDEQRMKTLIIQYDDSIRYRKKLLDCNLAEALLSIIPICMKNQETLDTKINEKVKECEKLKLCLEKARCKIAKLYAKYEENTQMKEFLDFAIFLSTFRDSNEESSSASNFVDDNFLGHCDISVEDDFMNESIDVQIDETATTDECKCSKIPLYPVNEDILTMKSKLETAHELLDIEKLERKRIESERDNYDKFSNELSYLLFKYYKHFCKSVETKATNTQTILHDDHWNTKAIFDSSTPPMNNLAKDDQMDTDSYVEFENKLSSSPASNFRDSLSLKNIDSGFTFPKTNKFSPVRYDEKCNSAELPEEVQNFEPIQESQSHSNISTPSTLMTSFQQSYLQINVPDTQISHHLHPSREVELKVTYSTLVPHTVSPNKSSERNGKLASQIPQFYCDICGGLYSNKRNLIQHIRAIHYLEKPYQCSACSKRFAHANNLRIHTFVHSSEKLFKCSFCDKSYKIPTSKSRHERINHRKYRFDCKKEHGSFST